MTITAIIPVIVCLIGMLVFLLTSGDAKELGRGAYWCGLLVSLFVFAGRTVHF